MQDTNRQFANQTVGSVNSPNRNKKLVSKSILPIMCEGCVSPTTLLVDGWAANSSVISLTAAEVYGSKARLRRATASTPQRTYEVYSIVGSVSARRFDRALKLSRPSFPSPAIGQKVGRRGTPKRPRAKGVNPCNPCNLCNSCSLHVPL